jgi:hypothetical protein
LRNKIADAFNVSSSTSKTTIAAAAMCWNSACGRAVHW